MCDMRGEFQSYTTQGRKSAQVNQITRLPTTLKIDIEKVP